MRLCLQNPLNLILQHVVAAENALIFFDNKLAISDRNHPVLSNPALALSQIDKAMQNLDIARISLQLLADVQEISMSSLYELLNSLKISDKARLPVVVRAGGVTRILGSAETTEEAEILGVASKLNFAKISRTEATDPSGQGEAHACYVLRP